MNIKNSLKHLPFSNFQESTELPYIPSIIKKDKDEVKKEILLFGENNKLNPKFEMITLSNRKSVLKGRESMKKILGTDTSTNENSVLKTDRQRNRYSTRLQKLREKFKDLSPNKIGIFLTNMSRNKNKNDDLTISNSVCLSSRISSGKKKITLGDKRDLLYNLEYLDLFSHNKLYNLQNNINNINYYEKKMIKKCNRVLIKNDKKFLIQSDEYLNENINPENDLNLKFNQYFDKLISQNKEFDYIAMLNLLKEREKKEIQEKINKLKIEKKHEKFLNLVKNGEIELQKAYDLYEQVKKKQLDEMNKYKKLRKKNVSSLI